MAKRFRVVKLDTGSPWWFVVDLLVPGAVLAALEAVVYRTLDYRDAHERADELNAAG